MSEMALILQGGGALGAYEYGAVTRLLELGWTPKAVTGVSIGAINAAAIAGAANGDIATSLRRVWEAITMHEVGWLPATRQGALSMLGNPNFYTPRMDVFNLPTWTNLYDTSPMYATLNTICDFRQINDASHMRMAVTATDLCTGGLTTFANHLAHEDAPTKSHHVAQEDAPTKSHHVSRKMTLDAAHVLASGSLPPSFPATEIDGHHYWDGGLFNNTPMDALLNMLEPDEVLNLPIFVMDLFPSAGLPLPANLMDVQNRTMMLQYQNRFWAQYGGGEQLTGYVDMLEGVDAELSTTSALRKRPAFQWLMRQRALKNMHVIEAVEPASSATYDFSPYAVECEFQRGKSAIDHHFASHTARPHARAGRAGGHGLHVPPAPARDAAHAARG